MTKTVARSAALGLIPQSSHADLAAALPGSEVAILSVEPALVVPLATGQGEEAAVAGPSRSDAHALRAGGSGDGDAGRRRHVPLSSPACVDDVEASEGPNDSLAPFEVTELPLAAVAEAVGRLALLHRDREDMVMVSVGIQQRIKARLRRLAAAKHGHTLPCSHCTRLAQEWAKGKGDDEGVIAAAAVSAPLLDVLKPIEANIRKIEREMAKAVALTPAGPFAAAHRGVGVLNLAKVIAETGDLASYERPAQLWKRMGLAVVEGAAQRKKAGHGFSPRRRAIAWLMGESVIKGGRGYREVYLERKRYESARHEECAWVEGGKVGCGRCHNRAHRYMEKRVLRDLWVAWRAA